MIHAGVRLGRIRPTAEHKAKALPLAKYMRRSLPPPPLSCNNTDGAELHMFGNDQYGDCTFAALGNYRAICAAKEGMCPPTSEADVINAYLKFTHGKDDGAIETEVLNRALDGLALGGGEPWKLAAWVTVDINDRETCRSLMAHFWSLYLGVALPVTAQDQEVWDVNPLRMYGDAAPGSWGGHAVLLSNYTEDGYVGIATWGAVKNATWRWLSAYCDEAYVLLDADRAQMAGVDWEALCDDLAQVA